MWTISAFQYLTFTVLPRLNNIHCNIKKSCHSYQLKNEKLYQLSCGLVILHWLFEHRPLWIDKWWRWNRALFSLACWAVLDGAHICCHQSKWLCAICKRQQTSKTRKHQQTGCNPDFRIVLSPNVCICVAYGLLTNGIDQTKPYLVLCALCLSGWSPFWGRTV